MKTKPNDGGPAFPRPASEYTAGGTLPDGNEAMAPQNGMTLRQWYAGQALNGWAAGRNRAMSDTRSDPSAVVVACLRYADEMIAAEKEPSRLAIECGRLCLEVLEMVKGFDPSKRQDATISLAWNSLVGNCISAGAVMPEEVADGK